MNNKRNSDDVLKSIFNLIKDAKKEFSSVSELNVEEKEVFTVKNLPYKKKVDLLKKTEPQKKDDSKHSNWNNITFKRIDLKSNKENFSKVKATDKNEMKFEKLLLDTFQSEIDKWQRKNLKKIIDLVFDEYSKEKLKKNLK